MSKELRYLLHENCSRYEDIQTTLYVTSQDSTVWQKVGQQVLKHKRENWRLIDAALVEAIRVDKYQSLGIRRLQPEQVVELIRELGPDSVKGNELRVSDRNELLRYISQLPANKELWKSLCLHETVEGPLNCIENGYAFLENPAFPLDLRLKEQIALIKPNPEIQQAWIQLWEPVHAITTVLQLSTPHTCSDIILDALNRLSQDEKKQQRDILQKAKWLPKSTDGSATAPVDILKVPHSLTQHENIIASLDNTKSSQNILPGMIRGAASYNWVSDLFTSWDIHEILEAILSYPNPDFQHWQRFYSVILDVLPNVKNDDLEQRISIDSWIPLHQQTIAPNQVIQILPDLLNHHLPTLINLTNENYFEVRQLPQGVRNHSSFKTLKNFFSNWDENFILSLVLEQDAPHHYCTIILDALSQLLKASYSPNQTNLEALKTKDWLFDKENTVVSPQYVIHYPGLEKEIEALLLIVPHINITSSQIDQKIQTSQGWAWLVEKLFLTQTDALKVLGKSLSKAPEYYLGDFTEFPLDTCLEVFFHIDVSFLPAWSFAQKLTKELFQEYLLPNLLDTMQKEKICQLLQVLSNSTSPADDNTIKVFNAYLRLAVEYDTFGQTILPQIHLLNKGEHWQTPGQLTWGKNTDNIDKAYVLNFQQTQIMSSYLSTLFHSNKTVSSIQTTSPENNNYEVLKAYFSAWDHCPPAIIGAFITLLMGNDAKVRDLAQLYLGSRDPLVVRDRLLEGQNSSNSHPDGYEFCIHVGHVGNSTTSVQAILGSMFNAVLAQSSQPNHLFVSQLSLETVDIDLLALHPDKFNDLTLSTLLFHSTKILLEEVYQADTSSISKFWAHLRQSDQLDIQVAKNFLLDGAPYIMRMLGAHERIPAIKTLLNRWDNLRHQRAVLEQQKRKLGDLDHDIAALILELSNLIEGESEESEQLRDHLLEAVREKIDLYGYRPQSIAFELFQNADDAVVEWLKMSPNQMLDAARTQFLIVTSENQLLFIHAGRPINCFQHPDSSGQHHREAGFDRDLEKMLTFNISDKGEQVTGKFGLGFKSVYLVCKEPHVVSKNLRFAVKGGLIPSRLDFTVAKELTKKLQTYLNLSDATAVELNLEEGYSVEDVMKPFQEFASILLVFSRAIKQCQFISASSYPLNLSWNPTPIPDVPGVEVGKQSISSKNHAGQPLLLCIKTIGDTEATLLLGMTEQDGRLSKTLPDDIPTFWVTAPTREVLSLGFALNASFDITTGRESLVKSSARNRDLAKRMGEALGEVLCSLVLASEQNWQSLSKTLGLTAVSKYEFWKFLWHELAVRWQQKNPSEGKEIINCILGGGRGMGYLITHCRALPSGLHGNYRQLLLLSEVRYQVTGKLSEPNIFSEVSNWTQFQQTYQGNLIAQSQWKHAKALLGSSFDSQNASVRELRLLDVLRTEIGATSPQVDSATARHVGSLITRDFLKSLEVSSEHSLLQDFLQDTKFMSQAGTYWPCQQLLCDRSSSPEETLLFAFAPDHRILHPDYQDSGLEFFYTSRSWRDSIAIDELTEWALQADTPERQEAVKNYLLSGEMRDRWAVRLYETCEDSWIIDDANIYDILKLMVQIATRRGESVTLHLPIPDRDQQSDYEFSDYDDLNYEFHNSCTQNDFSLSRSCDELNAFAQMLLEGLSYEQPIWKEGIYHFTHIENAVSIIQSGQIKARNYCQTFKDSAGAQLIHKTGSDVKDFARFYYRPQTPTQWHNEGLGKRRGNIYALCPVPIFFRFTLKSVLETHGSKCGSSSGNLAASSSHYGNSTAFLEQCFDFDHVYSSLPEVGKQIFLRAAQQEFIVHQGLNLEQLSLEDIEIICRNPQDKQTLLHLIGKGSKYSSRVFLENEIVGTGSIFYHENPSIVVNADKQPIEIKIDNYDNAMGDITGEIVLRLNQKSPLDYEVSSQSNKVFRVSWGNSIYVNASRIIQLQCKPNTLMTIYFQEKDNNWLIYTNEPSNH